ncbi:hypothetical protein YC2023_051182 [Brassica napus]
MDNSMFPTPFVWLRRVSLQRCTADRKMKPLARWNMNSMVVVAAAMHATSRFVDSTFKKCEKVSSPWLEPGKCLSSASPVPQTGVHHSTFESLCLGRSSQSIASGFLRFWDILNFKKDREFVGITVLFLNEKMWLGKSVLSRALTLPKKQLESLSVSSLIHTYEEDEDDDQDQ